MAPSFSTITLTTDFGMSDGYVGIVKGVILSINPHVSLIDCSHDIASWDIAAAAWVLWNTHRFFAPGTIHLCVVDPAVGSQTQRGVAIVKDDAIFVGPDNGIFSHVMQMPASIRQCYQLIDSTYWRQDVSSTFHTRDIYGPVCAHLSKGVPIADFGPEIPAETIKRIDLPEFSQSGTGQHGCIVYIDKFGNLISNIPGDTVKKGQTCFIDDKAAGTIGTTYADARKGQPAVFVGSHGFVEIGAYQDSAQAIFAAKVGATVRAELKP